MTNPTKINMWTQLLNSKVVAISALIVFLIFGTVFYKLYDDMSWSEAMYFAAGEGLRIGYDYPTSNSDKFSKVFSLVFKLLGISFLALLYTNLFRSSYFHGSEVRFARLTGAVGALLVLMLIGILWSYWALGWSGADSVYFVFSTYWWWGIYSVPTDSSDAVFGVSAVLAVLGGLAVFIVYGLLAAEAEIFIERSLLHLVAEQPFTSEELGMLHTLRYGASVSPTNDSNGDVQPTAPLDESTTIADDTVDDTKVTTSPLLQLPPSSGLRESPLEVDSHGVKYILLTRVLALKDVSSIYYHVRMHLTVGFAIVLAVATVFFQLHDDVGSWSLSGNYALSAVYKLGYSSGAVDSLNQAASVIFMLCGSLLFGALNVSILREFSLKTKDVRYFHTLVDGLLCVLLAIGATALFVDSYGYTRLSGAAFAIDIMVGDGGSTEFSGDAWCTWLLDAYTAAAVPLFAAYVSHVEVELDVSDAAGYMEGAVLAYFDQNDLRLLRAFEQTHSRSSAYGLFELHTLLTLRMKDAADFPALAERVNKEYSYAVSNGLTASTPRDNIIDNKCDGCNDNDVSGSTAVDIESRPLLAGPPTD